MRISLISLTTAVLVVASAAAPAFSAPLSSVKVVRILDGTAVFVDKSPARVNQVAGKGGIISSLESRAELLFDRRAIGLLGKNTLIKVGSRCFEINSGVIVVNGTQNACIGSRILGVRGTTYVLARESDDTYTVSVLAGESIIADALPDITTEQDILSMYPKLASSLSVQAGGFGAVYPSGGGSFTGGINYFAPLSQSGAKSILYSSTSIGSGFQSLWGASTELGYRSFSPSTRSTTSLYIGYSGYGAPGCFSNLINVGGQWEKSRWRLGASGGIKVNDCPAGLSYGALNLSIPVGNVRDQPLYVLLSPYILTGNAVGTGLLSATNDNVSPGLRASVEVPLSDRISVRGFTGADAVFGVTVGGFLTYRQPMARKMYLDPNIPQDDEARAKPTGLKSSIRSDLDTSVLTSINGPRIALSGTSQVVSDQLTLDLKPTELKAQTASPSEIPAGQRGRFSSSGALLGIEAIPKADLTALLMANLGGQNPLPESRRIAKQAYLQGALSTKLAGILGIDFLNNASFPVSTTVDTPFSPLTEMPVGRYVCSATPEARSRGALEAKPGEFNYNGEAAYFGRGSKASQGYPATTQKSEAYVFSDPGVCSELNRLTNQGYQVIQAERI